MAKRRAAGTGSVVWRGNRCYWVRPRHPVTGKPKWVPVRDEIEADELSVEWRRQVGDVSRARELEGEMFGPYADRWLRLKRATARRSTVDGYEDIIENHFKLVWRDEPLANITREQVQHYVAFKRSGEGEVGGKAKQQLKPQSIRNHLALLRQILQNAIDDGYRRGPNPVDGVERPSEDYEPRFLTQAEFDRLLSETPVGYQMLTLALKELGIRLGEAQALRWSDYDDEKRRLSIRQALKRDGFGPPKSRLGRRTLRVSDGFHARLMEHRSSLSSVQRAGGFIFPNSLGRPFNQSNFRNRVFGPAAARAGLDPLRPHDLRHTHAALAIEAGVNPKQLQRRLGHHSVRFTLEAYGGLYEDQLNEVVDTL